MPTTDLYFPAAQFVQLPPLGPFDPALHRQLVWKELPAGALEFVGHSTHALSNACAVAEEYLPAPQSTQAKSPTPLLYLPATQPTHPARSGLKNPALQIQSKPSSLPAGAFEFAVQTEHALSDVCPVIVEYLPAPQASQTAFPTRTCMLYVYYCRT